MNTWMLRHLSQFTRYDFQEYNSRHYQTYSFMALQNLYEFSEDARVRTAAWNILDYLAAKFAVSSANMRRLPPFRRNGEYRDDWGLYNPDGAAIRMLAMTGNADFLRGYQHPMVWDFGVGIGLPALAGSYRLPDVVGEKIFATDDNAHFERFAYDGLELYARRPEFLISAGGIYTKIQKWIPFEMPNDGYVMPTTLIPGAGLETDAHQLIRIEGHQNRTRRTNTCVAPDFACGLNPVVPSSLPAACVRKDGPWTFVNYTAPDCPLDYGFYAAVYSAPCDSQACRKGAGSYGFFEATPARGLGFEDFVSSTLVRNGSMQYSSLGAHHYVTTAGRDIEFEVMPPNSRTWPIVSLDGVDQNQVTRSWPLAQGEQAVDPLESE
jgi:hypothetical protein